MTHLHVGCASVEVTGGFPTSVACSWLHLYECFGEQELSGFAFKNKFDGMVPGEDKLQVDM